MSGLSKAMLPVMAPLPWVHALLVAVIDVVVRRSRCDVPAEGIECHRAELRVLVQGADVLTSPAHRA
jgi:hypothetical protein